MVVEETWPLHYKLVSDTVQGRDVNLSDFFLISDFFIKSNFKEARANLKATF